MQKELNSVKIILNEILGDQVFTERDENCLYNDKNRYEGNDIDIHYDNDEFTITVTGSTVKEKSKYDVVKQVIDLYSPEGECISEPVPVENKSNMHPIFAEALAPFKIR